MILILDNFDSFTYNLYQYFGELGEKTVVIRNNQCSLEDITGLDPELIVISPGPCTPTDTPFALQVIKHFIGRIPIFGVCLGHQALGQVLGGQVIQAQRPIHGKVSVIKHDGKGVFDALPNPLKVVRYHSLALQRNGLPSDLIVTAQSEDGEIMGIRHKYLPVEGVQFHPEAILTQSGHDLLRNAIRNARTWLQDTHSTHCRIRPLPCSILPYLLLPAFRQTSMPFFLDSGQDYPELGRYSFIGAFPFVSATAFNDRVEVAYPANDGMKVTYTTKTLDILDSVLAEYKVPNTTPFPFAGGAVGYLSYDLKDEIERLPQNAEDDLNIPLWRFAWYDGIIIYDHSTNQYWLTACGMDTQGQCRAELAEYRLDRLQNLVENYIQNEVLSDQGTEALPQHHTRINKSVTKHDYLQAISKVIDYIFQGDIYQANLTQRFSLSWDGDPWQLYQQLHQHNPAPFAAFLPYDDFQVLSSSPERFIKVDKNRKIETRPIKGTRPRGLTPDNDIKMANELQNSEKDKAELTMIVDLERNDLGRICSFGSVQVNDFMSLEKYPTVWHLVSTITGQINQDLSPSQILRALFPGGSITGAPKIRAMEIVDEIEPYKRGIYTGSIGYLGFDGAWDLNIVIRTIVLKDGKAYVHAGGGIVADSDPESEYAESINKAKALFHVLGGTIQDDQDAT